METYNSTGYHIGTFDEIFTKTEISFLENIRDEFIQIFSNPSNIDCKTQHSGNTHSYPFYDDDEYYTHPYVDIPLVDSYIIENNFSIIQRWKQLNGRVIYDNKTELSKLMNDVKYKILNKFYSEYELKKEDIDIGNEGTVGMYEKGDRQPPHFDAGSERTIFGCIFYLTPKNDWNEESGGELLLNQSGIKVPPIFGNYVVLDFTKHLLEHQVLELLKDYRRYTLISFPSVVMNNSDAVTKFLEKKKKTNVIIS